MKKKKKASGSYRMTVQFNTSDENQRFALNFLSICGYKKNQIIALMAKEFAETYNLNIEDMTMDDVKNFVDSYNYIQNFKNNKQIIPVVIDPGHGYSATNNISSQREAIQNAGHGSNMQNNSPSNSPEAADDYLPPHRPKVINDGLVDGFEMDSGKADKALAAFGL